MGISEGDFKKIGQLIESKMKSVVSSDVTNLINFTLDPIYLRLGMIDDRLQRIEGAITEDRNDILSIYELIKDLQISKADKVTL